MTTRPRTGRDLPPTPTERHPLLAAALMVVVLLLLGVLLGRIIGTVGAWMLMAALDPAVAG